MSVRNDKVYESIVRGIEPCKSLVPSVCGGKWIPRMNDIPCRYIYFVGVTDVTIMQDDTIDLTQGVHAYDGDGREVAYTYTPTSIDTSVAGEYVVTYTASGVSDGIYPSMCGDTALKLTECDYGTVVAERVITVKAKDAVVCEAKVCESPIAC